MAIMASVPQRRRWELSAFENQIIKLHSQTWLISEAVAFLQAERHKGADSRETKWAVHETLPCSDSVCELWSFSRQEDY